MKLTKRHEGFGRMNDNSTNDTGVLDLKGIFKVVLQEIFGDGVMTGEELKILKTVREIIPIEASEYKLILSEISANLMKETRTSEDDADPGEIFKKCCVIAFSRGYPNDSEIGLLKRLAEALMVPADEIGSILEDAGKAAKWTPPKGN